MTTELEAIRDQNFISRLISRINRQEPNDCWEFQGSLNHSGYGEIRWTYAVGYSRILRVHRVSWVLRHQVEIPEGMQICHHCDNPTCANPDHLFLGTMSDNTNDSVTKGRWSMGRNRELNWNLAFLIRMNSHLKQQEILDQLNLSVNQSVISRILNGYNWPDKNWDPSSKKYIGKPLQWEEEWGPYN